MNGCLGDHLKYGHVRIMISGLLADPGIDLCFCFCFTHVVLEPLLNCEHQSILDEIPSRPLNALKLTCYHSIVDLSD